MTNEQILTLVIITSVLVVAIGLVVFILVRNSVYKKFVLKESTAIRDLTALNEKYFFYNYDDVLKYHHRFDNKSSWKKTEPVAYLSREVRNNLSYWHEIRNKVNYNRETLKKYDNDVNRVFVQIGTEVCKQNKKSHKKCLKVEEKQFNKLVLKPKTYISITVVLQYVSPQGKVNVSKSGTFNYVALDRIIDSVSTRRVDRQTYEKLAKAERAMLSDSMRYDVLKRDGFRCVLCGMSAKDGAILHVDHIIPVSKGGKTELNNLRTLCEKCNIGKSNKIE